MSNLFEKSISLGLGLFVYSREKIEEVVDELVNKGEIAKKDAQRFAGELVKKGEEQRNELNTLVKNEVAKVLNHISIAKKEDVVTKDEISEIVRIQVTQILNEQGIYKKENSK